MQPGVVSGLTRKIRKKTLFKISRKIKKNFSKYFKKSLDKEKLVCYNIDTERKEKVQMTGKEIVKTIMEQKNVSNAELAHQVGIKPTAMWDRLNNTNSKDLNVALLSGMLRALGYKIQIVPYSKKNTEGVFEVE